MNTNSAINSNNKNQNSREFVLLPMEEYRAEIDSKNILIIKLLEGKAEIFGTELAPEINYQFTARKLAIFTFHGCKLLSNTTSINSGIGGANSGKARVFSLFHRYSIGSD